MSIAKVPHLIYMNTSKNSVPKINLNDQDNMIDITEFI